MSKHPASREDILLVYKKNIQQQGEFIKKLKNEKKIIAAARLMAAITGITVSWYFWPLAVPFTAAVILFSALMIFLVFRDADKSADIKNRERLIRINEHETGVMTGELYLSEYDDGQIFADPLHAYASDLDLFGPSSLFQFLNRCHAEQSRTLLADSMKKPLPCSRVKEKQEAAKELSGKQAACQQFQSGAMANPLSFKTENRLKHWMSQPAGIFEKPFWNVIRQIYPLITFSVLALYFLEYISTGYFLFFWIACIAFSFYISSKINPVYEMLGRIQPEIDLLHEQLDFVEKEFFNSTYLVSLQQRLNPSGKESASLSIRRFHIILKKFEYRLNWLVFLFLNSFLLWDLRQLNSLNKWKGENRNRPGEWITVIAEMEVLISLASLVFNEPEWGFPEMDTRYFHFHATEIGHPLISPSDRVTNDFIMEGEGKIAMITGSNMAGKSTFLRSLGINTVLAGMGAPVCAERMSLCETKMISSMRVADNLAENTSTFYAELKKLQNIIDAVNRREKVFILLDEVLRGTNSTDRHKGSRALVRQLLQGGAVAVVATHDTELALSESNANASVSNYHFDAKISGDELFFDYKIKNGICESLNATTLMKKIGIHFED
jgi:hypothetical protein